MEGCGEIIAGVHGGEFLGIYGNGLQMLVKEGPGSSGQIFVKLGQGGDGVGGSGGGSSHGREALAHEIVFVFGIRVGNGGNGRFRHGGR